MKIVKLSETPLTQREAIVAMLEGKTVVSSEFPDCLMRMGESQIEQRHIEDSFWEPTYIGEDETEFYLAEFQD